MGAVYAMTQLPQLLNARIPSEEQVRTARLLRWDEDHPDLEIRCEWEDGRVEWQRGFALGWTDRLVFVQFTWDGWQPVQRWIDASDVRRLDNDKE